MNKTIITIIAVIFIILAGLASISFLTNDKSNSGENKIQVTLYKSPTCGCCVKYVSYLEKQGFEVKTIPTRNMASIKNQYHIPRQMESCHTAVIGDYFIEGHIPMKAVNKLLSEKPDIDGISLPNMPSGTPGMPGIKQGKWQVHGLKDGEYTDYLLI